MEEIKLIKNKNELEGTCYFEFLPGKYKDHCWQDGSVFLDEEVFELIEHIFKKHVSKYDHYAFTEVKIEKWQLIISDLNKLMNKDTRLKEMVTDLINWINDVFTKEQIITVLGI